MTLDIRKLSKKIRTKLDTDDLLILLDRAIELMPHELLPEIFSDFFDVNELSIDPEVPEESLLDAVRIFSQESMVGSYYDSFDVNSRNFMDKSRGTINWIAEFDRLMERCFDESTSTEPALLRESFELLFNLLDEIDECRDDIIFFADEGGSWQVGVSWNVILPCYSKVLAAVAKPKEYAQNIILLIKRYAKHDFDRHIQEALEVANPAQKKALKTAVAG